MTDFGASLGSMAYRVLLQAADADSPQSVPAAAPTSDPVADDGLVQPHAGLGSPALDVFLCLLPIILLVLTTVWKKVQMSTSTSLPLAAALLWVIRLAYLKLDPNFTNAAVLYGLFDALKPLSIVTGAICLFQTMEATMCLPWMMSKVRTLSSGHPVAEVFLIGWAFAYMIEGCSGFGTPVALAAPMLVSLGHPPVESILCCLIMNTLATVFGAVGFPIWFGFAGLFDEGIEDKELKQVGLNAEVMLFVCAHFVPVIAASFLVRWEDLRASWKFILLSIWAAKLPAVAIAVVSTDFSTLIGGMVAMGVVGLMARFNFGLNEEPGRKHPDEKLAEVSKHLGSIYDPSRHPKDMNKSYRAGGRTSDINVERSLRSTAGDAIGDPSIRSHPLQNGTDIDIQPTKPQPQQQTPSPPLVQKYPPLSGVDGDSVGPSLSEQRGYGGKSEAESPPASPNSRRTPSAGPSQVSSVQQPAQITKSFNNRNTANTYTYRVAPRHGRAQNYPRDYVQSYSSSNAAAAPRGNSEVSRGAPRGRTRNGTQASSFTASHNNSDFTIDSRTQASSPTGSPMQSASPLSPNLRSRSPRHHDGGRQSPKRYGEGGARYEGGGSARPSVGPWAAGQRPSASRIAQDFGRSASNSGALGSRAGGNTLSSAGGGSNSGGVEGMSVPLGAHGHGHSHAHAQQLQQRNSNSGGVGGVGVGVHAPRGAPSANNGGHGGGGYGGVGLGSSSMSIWPRSRASGASSLSLSGGHARVVSGPLTPHMEEDELNYTEESVSRGEATGANGNRTSSGAVGGPGGGVSGESAMNRRPIRPPGRGIGEGSERSLTEDTVRLMGTHRVNACAEGFAVVQDDGSMCSSSAAMHVSISGQNEADSCAFSGSSRCCDACSGAWGEGDCEGASFVRNACGSCMMESGQHATRQRQCSCLEGRVRRAGGVVRAGPVAEADGGMGMGMGPEAAGAYGHGNRYHDIGADGRSVDGASVASTEKASVTLRVQPAPMLGNDRTRGVLRRGHNVSMHSRLSTAIDGASDDGKSGIMLTNGAGSSIHGGRTWEDMREDAVDVDTLDPEWGTTKQLILRTMPIWLTVVLLLLTRIDPMGESLRDAEPNFDIHFGYLFKFELSRTLVIRISEFFKELGEGTEERNGLSWTYELLYIPFLMPFLVASAITICVFRDSLPHGMSVLEPFRESCRRASKIALALFGSLVLVSLLRNAEVDEAAPAYIVGYNIADALKGGFVVFAAALGALGSFFSGSTTVSNLTFGIVHKVAAESINLTTTALLALQAVGATAGNMICINNIISARTVVGGRALCVSEGAFIMQTAPALGAMLLIGTLVALPFLLA